MGKDKNTRSKRLEIYLSLVFKKKKNWPYIFFIFLEKAKSKLLPKGQVTRIWHVTWIVKSTINNRFGIRKCAICGWKDDCAYFLEELTSSWLKGCKRNEGWNIAECLENKICLSSSLMQTMHLFLSMHITFAREHLFLCNIWTLSCHLDGFPFEVQKLS